MKQKILVIDNIDSFVYNLVQYLGEEGADPIVVNSKTSIKEVDRIIEENNIEKILISPGPKRPEDATLSCDIIRKYGPTKIILGICLGMQCIGYVYGGTIRKAKSLKHGKTSMVSHHCKGLLEGVANPFEAVRYHSLVVDDLTLPDCLKMCAISNDDKEIMALRHTRYKVGGMQFHPESILTEGGRIIIQNFLKL
jgi:anthranilate synthase/aminodeoxychorismate synthase-like glutamine amidotransferase